MINVTSLQRREQLLQDIYKEQLRNSKLRGHPPPKYTLYQFKERFMNDKTFVTLFRNWEEADKPLELKPSCDRLLDTKGYSFENIQWLTYDENRAKPKQLQQHKYVLLTKLKQPVAVFFGLNHAANLLKVSPNTIVEYAKNNTLWGQYYWQKIEDTLD